MINTTSTLITNLLCLFSSNHSLRQDLQIYMI